MIAFPMSNTVRPTIEDLVPGYAEVGISKRDAVRYIVDCHMRSYVARGKGNNALRRRNVRRLMTHLGCSYRKVISSFRQADEQAEQYSEARRTRLHDMKQMINFHE